MVTMDDGGSKYLVESNRELEAIIVEIGIFVDESDTFVLGVFG